MIEYSTWIDLVDAKAPIACQFPVTGVPLCPKGMPAELSLLLKTYLDKSFDTVAGVAVVVVEVGNEMPLALRQSRVHRVGTGNTPALAPSARVWPTFRKIHEADATITQSGQPVLCIVGTVVSNNDDLQIAICL